jgi:peptide/nickel transport system permease protein
MGAFWRYLAERIVILFATVFLSVTVVFFVPRLVPGDPLGAIFVNFSSIGGNMGGDALVQEYRERFGLDESMWNQYLSYLRELARGNLGYSIASFPSHVTDLLRTAIPWTVGLLALTTVISWILGTLLGALVGWRAERSPVLQSLVPVALVLYTTPYYILAIILLFLLTSTWPIFPRSGAYSVGTHPEISMDFVSDVIKHGTLPALSIVLVSLGWWFLSMRSLIVAEQGQDYILWAEAKGLGQRRIFWGYAVRNALLPQTTGLALSFGHIVGGALVTEVIFAYPGVGWLIYSSIKSLDYPVIQGSVLLIIFSVAIANFIMDLTYPLIDPRIRFGGSTRT